MSDLHQNHFELLNLPTQYAINLGALDQNYRRLQSEVHPDRFASAPAAERMRSMQLATQANEAYRTLKNPTARARYLLHINGIDTLEESNTAMPAEFLMLQMEWRESIEEACAEGDIAALEKLLKKTQQEARDLQAHLHQTLDIAQDGAPGHHFAQASEAVRKLSFIDKLSSEIAQAIIRLED
ncbi:MAG TPA: Fe-S protein assembly co-chaperone HscB [Methylophilaceae bacterium]|nr:Fe-S protein assembly co-chaperone HscB [Methylophilaceae bacterium]